MTIGDETSVQYSLRNIDEQLEQEIESMKRYMDGMEQT